MLTPSTAPAFVFVLLRVTGTTICRLREDMEEWAAWSGQHLFARLLCDGHDVPTYIVRVEHGKCMGVFVILLGARRRTPPNVSSASLARNGKRRESAMERRPRRAEGHLYALHRQSNMYVRVVKSNLGYYGARSQ